jgi:hypothetical protein
VKSKKGAHARHKAWNSEQTFKTPFCAKMKLAWLFHTITVPGVDVW